MGIKVILNGNALVELTMYSHMHAQCMQVQELILQQHTLVGFSHNFVPLVCDTNHGILKQHM